MRLTFERVGAHQDAQDVEAGASHRSATAAIRRPIGSPSPTECYGVLRGKARPMKVQMPPIPGRKFSKTDVVYRDTNILTAIEQLAQVMKLNVMFDQMAVNQMKMFKLTVELRDVTYPRALEMILKTNNLMYAQIDARTIVIAPDNAQQR
jgi:hypothetical protein